MPTTNKPTLELTNKAWMAKNLTDFVKDGKQIFTLYLGEAGTRNYDPNHYVKAERLKDDVLVSFRDHDCELIPADIVVKGFGEDLDGKTLKEIMTEGVRYDHNLKPIT